MVKSILSILIGTGGAQLLVFLCMPILSRVYVPESFGVFGYLGAIAGVVSIVGTLQLQHAIVLPKVQKHAKSLAGVITIGSFVMGLLTTLSLVGVSYGNALPFEISGIDALSAGILVFLLGHGQSLTSLVVRSNNFKHIGRSALIRAVAMIAAQLSFYRFQANGLLLGQVFAEFFAVIYMHRAAGHEFRYGVGINQIIVNVRRNSDFATNGTVQELVNSVSQGLPIFILGYFYGSSALGAYAFALKIMFAPAQLISNSIRHVYTAKTADKIKNKTNLYRDYWRSILLILIPSVLCSVLVSPFISILFVKIFGGQWAGAGDMSSWMVFWAAMAMANAPSSVMMRLLKKQKESLYLNIQVIVLRMAALIFSGFYFKSAIHAISLFVIVGVLWNLIYIYRAGVFAREYDESR